MPRRVLSVVSADIDATAGVGAVWVIWRPKSARAYEHIAFLERHEGEWEYVVGGSGPMGHPVGVDVIDVRAGGGVASLTRHRDSPHSVATASWINCALIRLGREVTCLLIGHRRLDTPDQREVIVAWRSSYADRGTRPLIVALGRDGVELSRLGPHDSLDSHTWARLRREEE
ncbi:hypothetical protein KGS77_10065 [Streptomyces sp. MST-110588]|nr:hypothetical protein KGS77_10065 [Streptomyces sp. MST-110588]